MGLISVITPVYNGAHYIEETILSIISQKGDFDLEYIIIDGLSADNTNIIIAKYKQLIEENGILLHCNSIKVVHVFEKDEGMYDALNKGLSLATGDIHCYLNASDLFLPGTLQAISTSFAQTDFTWIRGNVCYIDEFSTIQKFEQKLIYLNKYLLNGYHGFFNAFASQETMFWKKELTQKLKKIDPKYKYAGDFYLWYHFSKWATLVQLSIYTSCFRVHADQKSQALEKYMVECKEIISSNISPLWAANGFIYKYLLRHLFKKKLFYYPVSFLFFKPINFIDINNNKITIRKAYATVIN